MKIFDSSDWLGWDGDKMVFVRGVVMRIGGKGGCLVLGFR